MKKKKKVLNKFISVHIPKTGGTIFQRRVMNETLGRVRLDYPTRPLRPLIDDVASHYIIHGHFPASKYLSLKKPYVIWLRDPIKRITSEYNSPVRRRRYISFNDFIETKINVMSEYMDIPRRHFIFVGILEKWEDSITLFGDIIGVDLKKYIDPVFVNDVKSHYSRNREYIQPTPSQIRRMIDLNEKDIKLYNDERSKYA